MTENNKEHKPLPDSALNAVTRDRWIFVMPEVDAFLTKSVQLPQVYAHSDDGYTQATVCFHNAIGYPINAKLLKMMRDGRAFNAEIKLLDCMGTVIDRWRLTGATIDSIWWSSLDYAERTPMVTNVMIAFPQDNLQIVSEA